MKNLILITLLFLSVNVFGQSWIYVNKPKSLFTINSKADTTGTNGRITFQDDKLNKRAYVIDRKNFRAIRVDYTANNNNVVEFQYFICKKEDADAIANLQIKLQEAHFKTDSDGTLSNENYHMIVYSSETTGTVIFKFERKSFAKPVVAKSYTLTTI